MISVLARLDVATIVSLPAPAVMLSIASPKLRISLPAPESTVFEVPKVVIVSLPAPDETVSAKVPSAIISLADPVVIFIGVTESVPVIVTTDPASRVSALIVKAPPVAPKA